MLCVLSYDIIAECIVSFIVIKHLQLVFVWKMCVDSELAIDPCEGGGGSASCLSYGEGRGSL